MRTLIETGTIVSENSVSCGSIVIEDEHITEVTDIDIQPDASFDTIIDASGCYIIPGMIDSHVHFREPGLLTTILHFWIVWILVVYPVSNFSWGHQRATCSLTDVRLWNGCSVV